MKREGKEDQIRMKEQKIQTIMIFDNSTATWYAATKKNGDVILMDISNFIMQVAAKYISINTENIRFLSTSDLFGDQMIAYDNLMDIENDMKVEDFDLLYESLEPINKDEIPELDGDDSCLVFYE